MNEEKLPLEILKEKYIPVKEFPQQYNITEETIMKLIETHRLKYAEFKAPGELKRTPHCNPEDVLKAMKKEEGTHL